MGNAVSVPAPSDTIAEIAATLTERSLKMSKKRQPRQPKAKTAKPRKAKVSRYNGTMKSALARDFRTIVANPAYAVQDLTRGR